MAFGQRYAVVATELGLPAPASDPSIDSLLAALQATPHLSPQSRAGASWLICTGRYATEEQQESLAIALDAADTELAHRILARGIAATPRRVRSRRLLAVDRPIVDITRTALETGQSGIPRIVRLIAREAEESGSAILVVWAAGAPAQVHLDPEGRVDYPAAVWGGTRRWFNVSRGLRTAYWRLASRLAGLPGGFAIRGILRTLLAPFKMLDIGVSIPQEIILIPLAGVFEPEVTTSHAVDRLLPWLSAHPETSLTVLVHDALPITDPQFFPRDQRLEYLDYARLFRRSSQLIVATPSLRAIMSGLAAATGRTEPPAIHVVPFPAYSQSWDSTSEIEVHPPAFYMVGSPEGRKNYPTAVTALHVLAGQGYPAELHVIGARRGVEPRLRVAIERAQRAGASILIHGALPDDAVAGIARRCLALVYVSKAEGYGLPVREAQVMGCPVIASDIPSNRLFARDGGVRIVDHSSPTAIAQAMRDAIDAGHLPREGRSGASDVSVKEYGSTVMALVAPGSANAERPGP